MISIVETFRIFPSLDSIASESIEIVPIVYPACSVFLEMICATSTARPMLIPLALCAEQAAADVGPAAGEFPQCRCQEDLFGRRGTHRGHRFADPLVALGAGQPRLVEGLEYVGQAEVRVSFDGELEVPRRSDRRYVLSVRDAHPEMLCSCFG